MEGVDDKVWTAFTGYCKMKQVLSGRKITEIPDILKHKRIDPEKRMHDAEKPVELIKDIMRFCTKKGDTVLDPFGGSMSTLFAGLAIERHTVCIEIDTDMIQKVIGQRNQNVSLLSF